MSKLVNESLNEFVDPSGEYLSAGDFRAMEGAIELEFSDDEGEIVASREEQEEYLIEKGFRPAAVKAFLDTQEFEVNEEEDDGLITWEKLDKLAQERFGEFGFATLSEEQMEELLGQDVMDELNELAQDKFGEYGFATCDEDDMRYLINII